MKILIVTNMYPNSKDHFFGIFVKNQIDKIKNLNPAIKQDIFFIDGKQISKCLGNENRYLFKVS